MRSSSLVISQWDVENPSLIRRLFGRDGLEELSVARFGLLTYETQVRDKRLSWFAAAPSLRRALPSRTDASRESPLDSRALK